MKPKEIDYVRQTIEQEGFDYTFTGYSSFKGINDSEFHKLRIQYCEATKRLKAYLGVED